MALPTSVGAGDRRFESSPKNHWRAQRAIGDPRTQAITLNSLGFAYTHLKAPEKALENLKESVTLSRSIPGQRRTEGLALLNLGNASPRVREYSAAVEHYTLALAALQPWETVTHRARALEGLADGRRGPRQPGVLARHHI